MKKISFILLVAMLLSATNSFGQYRLSYLPADTIKLFSNEEFFYKSDYIIEFKPIWEYTTFYDIGGNYNPNEFYTSGLIIVTQIYKNDKAMSISVGDTINLIRKGGLIDEPREGDREVRVIESPHPVDYETGERGVATTGSIDSYTAIYFMKKSDLPENPDTSKRNKYPKVSMLQDITRAAINIGSRTSPGGPISGLNDLRFDNRYELYKYMEQFEGVTVPLSDPRQMHWYLFGNDNAFNQYLKERNVKDPRNPQVRDSVRRSIEMKFKAAKENTERKKKEQGVQKAPAANNILTVTIQNQAVRYESGKYYFHFDVYANANNSSTYFDCAQLGISYNTDAFGTNIAGNNKVTISNGAIFSTNPYNSHEMEDYDFEPNELILFFGTDYPAINPIRTQLTTTPVELFKVTIELLNNKQGVSSDIKFVTIPDACPLALFTPTSNGTSVTFYDDVVCYDPPAFTIYSVAPTLSSFTPTTRNAGVGETITIIGNNFGTQKGEVLFTRDGINQGATDYLKGLDEEYIVSWTNTQITVQVPSYVREGYVNKSGYRWTDATGFGSGAGTGKIKVKTARGDESSPSASSLTIEYSASNFSGRLTNAPISTRYTNPIDRVYLARLSANCNYDIIFTLHNSFQGSSTDKVNARNAVEDALQKWSSLLGIRLALEKDNFNNYAYESANSINWMNIRTKNIIGFAEPPSGSPPSADMVFENSEISMGELKGSTNDVKYFRDYGSHIYIKVSEPWDYNTTAGANIATGKKSFYNLMLHEIAHFLNLRHINNSSDLMYYSPNATTIINLTSTSKPVVGAATTVTASETMVWEIPKRIYKLSDQDNCPTVGYYDKITIQNPEPGRTDSFGNLLPPNTYIMNPSSTANFHAKFVSGEGNLPVVFDWLMVLYRSDGTEYIYAQQNNMGSNTYNSNDGTDGCFWQFTPGSLPADDWLYDSSGNIYGIVRVVVHISDGDVKSDQIEIGVIPPIIGPYSVCCNGSEFTLLNPPPGAIYWTVSDNSIFTVNSTGNPTTVTRIGTGTGSVTLSARTGSTSGTVLAIKTITPCPTTRIFADQTIDTTQTIEACNIDMQNVIVTNGATLTLNAVGDINVQNVRVEDESTLILDATGEVNINFPFKVELGSELKIIK